LVFTIAAALAEPALAHHVMGGKLPATFADGLLSGLGHPIIGLDHFAAVLAVGFIAGAHRAGPALVIGFIVAMMVGVAIHVGGASVPAAEIVVALTVIGLGAVMLRRSAIPTATALMLFVAVGLVHGYALGESIFGAERTPLVAYLAGLAIVQAAIAMAAMAAGRSVVRRQSDTLRLIGAGVAGVGIAILVQLIVPTV
jgi:urease accessory protein